MSFKIVRNDITFLEADGFEDAIRNTVSLGGDTDILNKFDTALARI